MISRRLADSTSRSEWQRVARTWWDNFISEAAQYRCVGPYYVVLIEGRVIGHQRCAKRTRRTSPDAPV